VIAILFFYRVSDALPTEIHSMGRRLGRDANGAGRWEQKLTDLARRGCCSAH